MRQPFPLFSTPIDLSHKLWLSLLNKDSIVIDATMGNGKDTLFIAKALFSKHNGKMYSMDIQEKALMKTQDLLKEHLPHDCTKVELLLQSHENFPEEIANGSVRLIVYNLGYLPGADKSVTTMTCSTLISVKKALELLCHGGCISIMCYPGHDEGSKEYIALKEWIQKLDPHLFSCTIFEWANRNASPALIFIQKCI